MSLRSQLEGVPRTVALMDAAIAALSATLLPDRLIPENLDVIGPAASLLVGVGFVATVLYREAIRRHARAITGVALGSLLVLLLVQVGFVVAVAPYGADAGTHRFLVGFSYTPLGEQWISQLGPMSQAEYLSAVGDDRIRALWGGSFLATAGVYALSYMAFVLSVVLMIGATDGGGRGSGPASEPAAGG